MTYYKMCYKIFIIVIILYSKERNKKKLNNRYYTKQTRFVVESVKRMQMSLITL